MKLQKIYTCAEKNLALTINISSSEKVVDIHWQNNQFFEFEPILQWLGEYAIGRSFYNVYCDAFNDYLKNHQQVPEFPIPFFLLDAMYRDFSGHLPVLENLKAKDANLVCRCFGVFENDLRKIVNSHDLDTVNDLAKYTKAGMGCCSCLTQINKIFQEEIENQELFKAYRPAGLTPAQLVITVQKILNECNPHVAILGFKGLALEVDADAEETLNLEKYIRQQLKSESIYLISKDQRN